MAVNVFEMRLSSKRLFCSISELRQSRRVIAMLRVVESERCSGIEIDEPCSTTWMVGGDGALFFSRNRVPYEDRTSEVQGINHRDHIISEPLWVISGLRCGGLSYPAPRNPNDVITRRELRPEAVKNVGCVTETCEKYEVAPGPSPVEHFEFYIRLNLDELSFERGLALKRGSAMGKSRAGGY